jgi:dolichol kinase
MNNKNSLRAKSGAKAAIHGFTNEFIRKGIHFLIAFIPLIAGFSMQLALALLSLGSVLYAWFELLRLAGIEVPVFSAITRKASRPRDGSRFVLGPITLATGAFLALLLFPPDVAKIAIFALAFGDGFASLIGRNLGRIRPAFLMGKSVEGSAACFFSVFAASYSVCRNIPAAFVCAYVATAAEAFPIDDFDNILIPVVTGFAAKICLGV